MYILTHLYNEYLWYLLMNSLEIVAIFAKRGYSILTVNTPSSLTTLSFTSSSSVTFNPSIFSSTCGSLIKFTFTLTAGWSSANLHIAEGPKRTNFQSWWPPISTTSGFSGQANFYQEEQQGKSYMTWSLHIHNQPPSPITNKAYQHYCLSYTHTHKIKLPLHHSLHFHLPSFFSSSFSSLPPLSFHSELLKIRQS